MYFKPAGNLPQPLPSRRTFLKVMAASTGILAVGSVLPAGQAAAQENAAPPPFPKQPDAFVRIAPDNSVTVVVKHLDKEFLRYRKMTPSVAGPRFLKVSPMHGLR